MKSQCSSTTYLPWNGTQLLSLWDAFRNILNYILGTESYLWRWSWAKNWWTAAASPWHQGAVCLCFWAASHQLHRLPRNNAFVVCFGTLLERCFTTHFACVMHNCEFCWSGWGGFDKRGVMVKPHSQLRYKWLVSSLENNKIQQIFFRHLAHYGVEERLEWLKPLGIDFLRQAEPLIQLGVQETSPANQLNYVNSSIRM